MLLLISNKNMKIVKTKASIKNSQLFEIAETQQGYFTAKQAESVGFLPTNYQHHVGTGAWIREDRGIYRLRNFPYSQVAAQYAFYSLWSRDRNDKPQGVYSHETALAIFELSDVNPSKIHMTVPTAFRKSAKTPEILKLYYKNLNQSDIQSRDGFMVTKPLKTILDLMEDKTTSLEFVEQALIEGIIRGLIHLKALESDRIPESIRTTFRNWIKQSKQFKKAMGA